MKRPTNKQVKDALDHCIDKRWRVIIEEFGGGYDCCVPDCALCELFLHGVPGVLPLGCRACPLYLYDGRTCFEKHSPFNKWLNSTIRSTAPKHAQNMLNVLIATRTHFFGEEK